MSGLDEFNGQDPETAKERLLVCLDVPRWADAVVAGRPFETVDSVVTAATYEATLMTDDELERALQRHPRIGERADAAKHDAAHSATEQAGVDRSDAQLAEDLRAGNLAYEERFDRVFLIRAKGRDGHEILAELRRRLGNTDERERAETVQQLAEIAALRLREAMA